MATPWCRASFIGGVVRRFAPLLCLAACEASDPGDAVGTGGSQGGSAGTAGTMGTAGDGVSGGTAGGGGAAGAAAGGAPAAGSGGTSSGNSGGMNSGGDANAGGQSGTDSGGGGNGGAGGAGSGGIGGAGASAGVGGSGGASGGGTGGSSQTCMSSLTSGSSNRTIQIGGTSRTYILYVPSSYTGMTPVPLVLDFHGLGGSGMQEQSASGYRQVADREGFLIAFPNGIDAAWNIGPCCTNSREVDDLGFAKGIVTEVAGDGCVDPKRVYATGISMGGGMSHHLACNAADVFAAVTPAAFDLLVPEEQPCAPARPISVLAFRGTNDTVVPYAGGPGSSGRVTFMGAQASFQRWAEINGCMGATMTSGECTYYTQCEAGVQVGLCVEQGGGHAGGDASAGWDFLSKYTLP